MTVFVDKIKFTIAAITGLVFFLLSILFFLMHFWILAVIALAGMVVYVILAIRNARTVTVSKEKLTMKLLGSTQLEVPWSSIKEVGIAGTKVLKAAGSNWSGARYIYFSTEHMSDQERFNMCLEWAPKDKIFFRFSYKRISKIIKIWNDEIVQYNTKTLNIYN